MDIQHRSALTGMAGAVLRPLIKVLIRHNFTHSDLTELVRKSYVEVAYDAFAKPERRMTYSRAALLTGLSRKEVVRLRKLIEKEEQHGPSRVAMQVVQGWLSDTHFLTHDSKPKSLKINEGNASFIKLVQKYAPGVNHADVLEQLNRTGLTSQADAQTVTLVRSEYIPQHEEMEKIRVMSVCVSDLFTTAVHRTNSSISDIRFQRQLVYSGIEESLAKRFHDVGSERAIALFETLEEFLFSGRAHSEANQSESGKRVGLGIYYFEGANQIKSVKMTSEENV